MLRLHYVDGVTTAKLATMFGLSRATMIRRLAEARASLVDGVKTQLRAASGAAACDFESVLRLVKSQIDLRLSIVLRDHDGRALREAKDNQEPVFRPATPSKE